MTRGRGPTHARERGGSAFTIVELLVVVAIIAVLLSITVPALGGARREASKTVCAARIRNVYLTQLTYADAHRGAWPNAFGPDTQVVNWIMGETETVTTTALSQTTHWFGPVVMSRVIDPVLDAEPWTCPEVYRASYEGRRINPEETSCDAYYYSAALYTSSELWDPLVPASARLADGSRSTQRVSSVAYPSDLVVNFEAASFHGDLVRLDTGEHTETTKVNTAAADGHVAYRSAGESEPVEVLWGDVLLGAPSVYAMPFSAPEGGVVGREAARSPGG